MTSLKTLVCAAMIELMASVCISPTVRTGSVCVDEA